MTLTSKSNSAIKSASWNCAFVYGASTDAEPVVNQTFGYVALTNVYPKVPALKATTSGSSNRYLYTGKWTKVKVTVRNKGNRAATKVTVKATGSRLSIKPKSAKLSTIAAGSAKSYNFKVRLNKGAASRVTFTAKTAGSSAKSSVAIRYKPKPKRFSSLSGRYFWGFDASVSKGWNNRAIFFVNKKWAYLGFPRSGVPTCSKKTCKRYSYNKKKGTLKIGSVEGKVNTAGLKLGKKSYYRLALPKAGKRFKVALVHKDFNGCMGSPYCSTWTERLVLNTKGKFVRSKSTIVSFGTPGGAGTWYTGAGPNERGSYKVLSKGRIRFSYANGVTKTQTIGVEYSPAGKQSPQGEGLVIGKTNFYPR